MTYPFRVLLTIDSRETAQDKKKEKGKKGKGGGAVGGGREGWECITSSPPPRDLPKSPPHEEIEWNNEPSTRSLYTVSKPLDPAQWMQEMQGADR